MKGGPARSPMAASQGDRLPMIAVMMHSPQQNVCIGAPVTGEGEKAGGHCFLDGHDPSTGRSSRLSGGCKLSKNKPAWH